MRSMDTIILRVRAGLPITEEEREAAHSYLDAALKRQRRFMLFCCTIPLIALVVVAVLAELGVIK